MYRAKTHGRSRIELFDELSRSQTVDRLALETAMHGALEREEFRLVYQAKVSLMSGQVTGFEALLRWHHPERGVLHPAGVHLDRRGQRADRADRPLGDRERGAPGGRVGGRARRRSRR